MTVSEWCGEVLFLSMPRIRAASLPFLVSFCEVCNANRLHRMHGAARCAR